MSADRLVGLVRDAVAAGVPQTAEGLAGFATQRAPDLTEAARAFGDLAQRGLVAPLDNNQVAAHEDLPIAADLAARLRVSHASAQLAIAAARLMTEGGHAAPYVPGVAQPYAPVASAPAPSSQKPFWQQPIAWVGLAVAGGLLYYTMKPDVPVPNNTSQPDVTASPSIPTADRTATPASDNGDPPMLLREDQFTSVEQLATVRLVQDDEKNRVGVRFLFDQGQGPIDTVVLWPKAGPDAGEAEVIMSKPGTRLQGPGDNGNYRAFGRFERRPTKTIFAMYRFVPGDELTGENPPKVRITIGLAAPAAVQRSGKGGMIAVDFLGTDTGSAGLLPNVN